MHRVRALVFFTLLSGPVLAQQFLETFSYPNGPTIPGWTPRNNGNWSISNGRLTKTGGSSPDFLTKDGITAKNCVLDLEVFYGAVSGVQHGGLTARHPGTSTTTPALFCKIQDNGGTTDLDRCFVYENGGSGSAYTDIVPGVQTARIRLVTLDNTATMLIDTNKDGTFDLTVGPRTLTVMLGSGLVGCSITSSCQVDNFKFFDGVLAEKSGSVPKIGTTYNLRFATPAPRFTPWAAGFALSSGGIPLGSRAVPLGLDPLLDLTLSNAGALGLTGITDANGDGNLAFPIPNNPALIGFAFFAGAFTLYGTMPFHVGVISQDLRVVVQA